MRNFLAYTRNSSHVELYFLAKERVNFLAVKSSKCEEFLSMLRNSSHVEGFKTQSCSEITVISLQDYGQKHSTCEEFFRELRNSSYVEGFWRY